jgi:hypothetical protein
VNRSQKRIRRLQKKIQEGYTTVREESRKVSTLKDTHPAASASPLLGEAGNFLGKFPQKPRERVMQQKLWMVYFLVWREEETILIS